MKTLYININNEPIESNDKLEVLKHDLDGDFFFYLGGKIAGGNIDNEKALVTDFNTESTQSDYRQIIEQWGRVKSILLGEKCKGEFEFTLPDDYIHWLHFDPQYNSIYNNRFANGQSKVITIDLEELYEESVEDLQRKILRRLREDNLSEEIDEIVFNDEAVVRKSPIVSAIKSRYDNIGFKAYKKWLQDNDEKPHTTPQVCEKCKKNPCECNINPILSDNFFPYNGFTLGETLMKEFGDDLFDDGSIIHYDLDNGVTLLGATEGEVFLAAMVDSTISSKNKLPKEWCNLLGCRFGTFREKCRRALSEKDFEIILDEDAEIIVVSPSKKYRIHLALDVDTSKFVALLITLNECPHCKSNNFALRKMNAEMHISYCSDCNEYYLPIDESENDEDDLELLNCPNCSSDDVDDDGSDYLQYTCNDCGHNWGHDDTVECPECGSDDVENDGTDNMQYECNACGHIWGDDEVYDNDDEDELDYDHPLSLNDFFPAWNITLNKSTVKDVENLSFLYEKIDYAEDGTVTVWVDGVQIRKEKGCDVFTNVYMTCFDEMYIEWFAYGFDWKLSYVEWIKVFKRLGFIVKQTQTPRVKSWEHGPDYLEAKFIARSADSSLKFELQFDFGCEGSTQNSPSTLYSIRVYSNRYKSGEGIHLQTFWNLDDLYRKDPIKFL